MSYGRLYSAVCDDLEAFERDYNNVGFYTVFGEDVELIKRTYVMDMIVAAVLLLVSLCLVAISILILRFTNAFTINEDYKEIGIMKAIGIGDRAIRKQRAQSQ